MNFDIDQPIKSLLDIGANSGEFSNQFRSKYGASCVCLEPSSVHIDNLNAQGFETYQVGASNFNGTKTFYVNSNNPKSTGNSFYPEQTFHFKNNTKIIDVEVIRLDDFFKDRVFDFVKIDTQGSEHDIIEGGKDLIKKAKFLLTEVSFFPYNKNSKLANDIIPLITSLGFRPYQFTEFHKVASSDFNNVFVTDFQETFIVQVDILWKNNL